MNSWIQIVFEIREFCFCVQNAILSVEKENCVLNDHETINLMSGQGFFKDYNLRFAFLTGKSTLMNHLFYTNFLEMDAEEGRYAAFSVEFICLRKAFFFFFQFS